MGHLYLLGGAFAVQVGDGHGGALLAPEQVHHRLLGKTAHLGAVDLGDVVALLDAHIGGGRTAVHLGHPGVARGGILDHFHADAHKGAVLDIQQLGVFGGGIIGGVGIVDAKDIPGSQHIVELLVVDLAVIVVTDIFVDLGQLGIDLFPLPHRVHGNGEPLLGQYKGDGKGDRHGDERQSDGQTNGNFFIHTATLRLSGGFSPGPPAQGRPR